MKRSAFGGGIKAGGRNYVSCFVNIQELPASKKTMNENNRFKAFSSLLNADENRRFQTATDSYLKNWETEFSQEKDIHQLTGEKNTFRYLPLKNMALRVSAEDYLCDLFMVLAAAAITKTPIVVSMDEKDVKLDVLKRCASKDLSLSIESETTFLNHLQDYERVRTCSDKLSADMYLKAAESGTWIATAKPLAEGRLELLHYLKEQCIAYEYHRYGSMTEKP
jgi:RHH-type proline utilization regulon transcriptional repressor/proline dehydrogenase/delta 1-pyrroline-5-carboxylate dehydrogenase